MIAAFVLYFVVLLAIGGYAWWNTRNLSDYILGGRRLGPTSAALSAGASDMSGWLLLGLPGYAYVSGLESIWLALALLLGSYFNWLLVAPRLRSQSAQLGDALTIPEYFSRSAHGANRSLRLVCGTMILVFYLVYTASGFVAGAKLFGAAYGVDYHVALLLGAAVIVSYTFFGGFLAVVWTDVLQGLMMLVALLWVPITVFSSGGEYPESLNLSVAGLLPLDGDGTIAWIGLVSALAWGLGYFGQPHILARFMAIKDPGQIGVARRIAITWTGLCLLGAIGVGVGGVSVFDPPLVDAETVFMQMVNTLFHPVIAGLLLAAIMAAIMSTADSQLLVASSVISEDLCNTLSSARLSDSTLLWLGRLAVLLMAAIALFLSWNPDAAVLDLVGYAWAGFGASIGPALLLSLYARRVQGVTLLAAMLAGGITVILWRQGEGGWFELYEMVPGIMASCITMLICHRALSPRKDMAATQLP
jgi:sodium/proline symporter